MHAFDSCLRHVVTRQHATTEDSSCEPRPDYCRFSSAGCNRREIARWNRL